MDFRTKQEGRRAEVYTARFTTLAGETAARDWVQMVDGDWGMGFFQYSACNYCDDVMAETADISFGDAWVAPYSNDGRGTNVVVVRSPSLVSLFHEASKKKRIEITSVDGEFLARTQAAGLRQRREGLAYRLHLRRGHDFTPRKRVKAAATGIGWRRRRIYDLRRAISHWSHLIFAAAERSRMQWLYVTWARVMKKIYRMAQLFERRQLGRRLLQMAFK